MKQHEIIKKIPFLGEFSRIIFQHINGEFFSYMSIVQLFVLKSKKEQSQQVPHSTAIQ